MRILVDNFTYIYHRRYGSVCQYCWPIEATICQTTPTRSPSLTTPKAKHSPTCSQAQPQSDWGRTKISHKKCTQVFSLLPSQTTGEVILPGTQSKYRCILYRSMDISTCIGSSQPTKWKPILLKYTLQNARKLNALCITSWIIWTMMWLSSHNSSSPM